MIVTMSVPMRRRMINSSSMFTTNLAKVDMWPVHLGMVLRGLMLNFHIIPKAHAGGGMRCVRDRVILRSWSMLVRICESNVTVLRVLVGC